MAFLRPVTWYCFVQVSPNNKRNRNKIGSAKHLLTASTRTTLQTSWVNIIMAMTSISPWLLSLLAWNFPFACIFRNWSYSFILVWSLSSKIKTNIPGKCQEEHPKLKWPGSKFILKFLINYYYLLYAEIVLCVYVIWKSVYKKQMFFSTIVETFYYCNHKLGL